MTQIKLINDLSGRKYHKNYYRVFLCSETNNKINMQMEVHNLDSTNCSGSTEACNIISQKQPDLHISAGHN